MDKFLDFANFLVSEDIDIFLSDSPVDKTALKEVKKNHPSIKPQIKKETSIQTLNPNLVIKKEIDFLKINTLKELKQAIADFEHPLKQTALNMVFSKGNADSPKIMFIGEAPGQEEDLKGVPFIGKAGQLLDKMIGAMKLTSEDYYISNVVNYRPENNKTPTEEEITDFLPFLKKHIELVKPQTICILGAVSLKALFPDIGGINKNRGEWLEFNNIPTIATFHPAYLLRFGNKKKDAWEDLQKLQKQIS